MLEKTANGWVCTDCGHSQADIHCLENCPKCKTPLQTDKTRAQRSALAANQKFLSMVGDAIRENLDTQIMLTMKVVRGRLVSIKVNTSEDCPLDMRGE